MKEADRQMNMIACYIQNVFGIKRRREFLKEVRQTTTLLKRSPNIGQIDPLFKDCTIAYRSIIINGLNKMVYYIDDDTIYILAFWDTRREPVKQADVIK